MDFGEKKSKCRNDWNRLIIVQYHKKQSDFLPHHTQVFALVKVWYLIELLQPPSSQIVKWSNKSACCIYQNNFLSCNESYQLVWLNVSKRSCRLGLRYLGHNLLLISYYIISLNMVSTVSGLSSLAWIPCFTQDWKPSWTKYGLCHIKMQTNN